MFFKKNFKDGFKDIQNIYLSIVMSVYISKKFFLTRTVVTYMLSNAWLLQIKLFLSTFLNLCLVLAFILFSPKYCSLVCML